MPNVSDSARKRTLADWVVKTKKQVVKLYAIAKWSRDADVVQKAMVRRIFHYYVVGLALLFELEHYGVSYESKPTIRRSNFWTQLCKRQP